MKKRARGDWTVVRGVKKRRVVNYGTTYPRYTNNAFVIPRPLQGVVRASGAYRRSAPGSVEKKYHDIHRVRGNLNLGEVIQLCEIKQGTGDTERIGNKLIIKNINVRFRYKLNTTVNRGSVFRMMLVQDLQCNGTEATEADLLDGYYDEANPPVFQPPVVQSFRNLDNDERFKVLYDKFTTLNHDLVTSGGASDQSQSAVKKINKKCNIQINYNNNTGALTEIRSNNLFLFIFSDLEDGTVTVDARLKYTDQ